MLIIIMLPSFSASLPCLHSLLQLLFLLQPPSLLQLLQLLPRNKLS